MARAFDGSDQRLSSSGTPVTDAPFTMVAWAYATSDSWGTIIAIADSGANDEAYALVRAPTDDRLLLFRTTTGTNDYSYGSSDLFTINAWHHVCVVVTAADDVAFFIDGGDKASDATSIAITGWDTVGMGAIPHSAPDTFLPGYVAEGALWNAALTDAEVAILALGYSPLFVRPQSLAAYWPLIRDTDNDVVGGYDMTAYNTPTVAAHPPVIYPASPLISVPAAAAAAGNPWYAYAQQ